MADANARLRLTVEAIDRSSPVFAAIIANAKKVAQQINAALNPQGSGNTTNNTLNSLSAQVGGIVGSLDGMNNQMNNFVGQFDKIVINAPKAKTELDKMFALQVIDQYLQKLKDVGQAIMSFIGEGMEDAADKESALIKVVQGVLINNPSVYSQLKASGQDAYNAFSNSIKDMAGKEAIRVGLATTFSDNEVAQGIAKLAQSGIPLEDILNGVAEAMANLAQIGEVDIVTSAKSMISIYNQFGKQLKEEFGGDTVAAFRHVSDVITNAMGASGVEFTRFVNSLTYSGTVSALAGQSFEDVATVLALFAKGGIEGSKAGTGLRRIITNLTPPTEKAEEAMARLVGVTSGGSGIFYDAAGKMLPLVQVQELLYEKMKDKTPQEQVELMRQIFGQYAIGQALLFATQEEFGNLSAKIQQTGTAQRTINEIMAGSKGITDRYNESIRTLQETMGTTANQAVNPFKTAISDLIQTYISLPESTQTAVTAFVGSIGVIASLAGTIGSAIIGWKLFTAALSAAGIALGAVASTVGIVVAAIAGIVAAVAGAYYAWTNNIGGIRDITNQAWSEILAIFERFRGWWNTNITPIMQELSEAWSPVWVSIINFFNTNVVNAFSNAWTRIKEMVSNAWETIKSVIDGALKMIGGIVLTFGGIITGDWDRIWEGMKTTFTGFWQIVSSVVEGALTMLGDLFKTFADLILGIFGGTWDGLVESTKSMFTSMWDSLSSFFSNLPSKMYDWGNNMITMLVNGIKSKVSSVTDAVSGIAESIKGFLGFSSPTELGPAKSSDDWMPNMIQMFTDGIKSSRPAFQDALNGLAMDTRLVTSPGSLGSTITAPSSGYNRSIVVNITFEAPVSASDADRIAERVGREVGYVIGN